MAIGIKSNQEEQHAMNVIQQLAYKSFASRCRWGNENSLNLINQLWSAILMAHTIPHVTHVAHVAYNLYKHAQVVTLSQIIDIQETNLKVSGLWNSSLRFLSAKKIITQRKKISTIL